MPVQPLHDDSCNVNLLFHGQRPAFWYAVPLFKTTTAAATSGMLGYERWKYAMPHWCLLAVVWYDCRYKPFGDGLTCTLLPLFIFFFVHFGKEICKRFVV